MSTRMITLQEAVRLISSDKAKERSEGIEQYKDIFQDQSVLENISKDDDDGRRWLRTMQALFNCVVNDKSACIKRGSWVDAAPISIRRLKESAQMVQWMVEKAHTYYSQPVFLAAFSHLSQMLNYGGQLFEPVAVEYLKALRTLLAYQPHLDHLDAKSWKDAVSLCFNILLNDDMVGELDDSPLEELFSAKDDDVVMLPQQRASRLLDAEVASCLHILVTASNAPLVGGHRWGVYALAKYATFLLSYNTDTTAHLPILQGINHILAELEVNESFFLVHFAIQVWASLLNLWSTKSRQLKEQLLISLQILLPFLANKLEHADKVALLQKRLLDEPDQRFALQPLSFVSVELCSSSFEDAFQYLSVRAGQAFSATDAQTWAALELGADCSLSLYRINTQKAFGQEIEPRSNKRRKDMNGSVAAQHTSAIRLVIDLATNARRGHDGKALQTWGLQMLLFIALRYRSSTCSDDRWILEALPSISEVIGQSDLDLQSWSLLILSVLAPYEVSKVTCKQVWPTVCRRVLQAGTSRTASHAAKAILESGYLQQREVMTELESIFSDLEMQGPSCPFDSVCAFLSEAVLLLSKDVGAVRQRPGEKVLAWLQGVWLPSNVSSKQSRSNSSKRDQDPLDILYILSAVCSFSTNGPWLRAPLLLPMTPIATRLRQAQDVYAIRTFALTAKLSDDDSQERNSRIQTGLAQSTSPRGPKKLEVRCLNLLLKGLKSFVNELSDKEQADPAEEEYIGRALDFATLSLLFNATLQLNHIQSQKHLVDLACELLAVVISLLSQPGLSNDTIAKIMSSFVPLLGCSTEAPIPGISAIEKPGKQSGIQTEVLLDSSSSKEKEDDLGRLDEVMGMVWHSAKVLFLVSALRDLHDRLTSAVQGEPTRTAEQREDDIWAGISRSSAASKGTLLDPSKEANAITVAHTCIAAILDLPSWSACDSSSGNQLKQLLLHQDTALYTLLLSGHLLFKAIGSGRIVLSVDELERVLETIGDDIMAEYKYQNSLDAQIVAIEFLDTTISHWSSLSHESSVLRNILKLCSFFVKQMNKGNLTWRVEARLATFLEHFLASSLQENSALSNVKTSVLTPEAIIYSLMALNGRPDMRLRWVSSTRSARLYEQWSQLGLSPNQLYDQTEKLLPRETDHVELMASRILFFGNSLVASSEIRHLALYHLIELVLVDYAFNDWTESVLASSSKLLGFPSTSSLWLLFARQMTWSLAETEHEICKVPHQVVGYASQGEMLQDCFQQIASILVASGTEAAHKEFRDLVALSGTTIRQGLLECIPFLTATDLRFCVEEKSETPYATMFEQMSSRFQDSSNNASKLVTRALLARLDSIIVGILRLFYEPDGKNFLTFLDQKDPTCATVLRSMDGLAGLKSHEPYRPYSEGDKVYESIMVLAKEIGATLEPGAVYCVIHQMVNLIYQERLTNDQSRHLQALKLYLAVARKSVEGSPAIIRLLVRSCAILSSQVDLVEIVWPLFDWTIGAIKTEIPGLSSSVLLLLRHANHFTQSKYSRLQQTGEQLMERICRLVVRLKDLKEAKRAALEIICAWPGPHPLSLTTKKWEISMSILTNALRATSTVSAPFLGRFVSALQKSDSEKKDQFRSTTIWTILECLKEETLNEEERGQIAVCLADLLYQSDGKISSPFNSQSQYDLADRKGALTAICKIDTQGLQPLQPLKSWLTRQLIVLSRSTDLQSAETAIKCLRAVFTLEPQFAGGNLSDWPLLDAEDLRLITTFPSSATIKSRSRDELDGELSFQSAQDFKVWICWICSLICDLMVDKVDCTPCAQLSSLVASNSKFAKNSFAILLHIILRSDLQNNIEQRLDTIALSRHLLIALRSHQTDKEVWKAIIEAVVQLRNDSPGDGSLDCDRWIVDIDYLLLEKRATQCNLYSTALLFAELEREHRKKEQKVDDGYTKLTLQYEIYSNIEDPDSFYGIKNPDVRDSLVNRLEHEGQWHRLFDFYSAQHESSESHLDGIAMSLHHQGFHRLSLTVNEEQKSAYDAAWRIEKWDLPVQTLQAGTSQTLFSALRAINREREVTVYKKAIKEAFAAEYFGLASANIEANEAARSSVRDLLGLREVSLWNDDSISAQPWSTLAKKFEFDNLERLISVRLSLIRSQRRRLESSQLVGISDEVSTNLSNAECSALLALSQEARSDSSLQVAVNSITQAQRLTKEIAHPAVEEEFANLLWDLGDHAIAIEALGRITESSIMKKTDQTGKTVFTGKTGSLPLALARLGHWRATARSHQPQTIRDECFIPARALADDNLSLSMDEKATVLMQYATFAHEQYQILSNSNEGDHLRAFIHYRREEIEQIDVQVAKATIKSPNIDKLLYAKQKAERILEVDVQKLNEFEKSKMRFRKEAARMYASSLVATDYFNDKAIIRLISLWFENAEDESLNRDLNSWLKGIASYKFLPFVHQISSRLKPSSSSSVSSTPSATSSTLSSCSDFQKSITDIVFRMGVEHPFHSLYALYALTRAEDARGGRQQGSRGRSTLSKSSIPPHSNTSSTQQVRKDAAINLIKQVHLNSLNKKRISDWEQVCDACVEWAQFDLPVQMPEVFGSKPESKAKRAKNHAILAKFNLRISRLHNVDVPVLTKPLAVDCTMEYNDFVSIAGFGDRFSTAGGLHLPKITTCKGSDGKDYKQLFKDRDDLRQDAIMQQVFGILNGLLSVDRAARKRHLRVRTYAVIPLGPRFGLLEFVGNTVPIADPLIESHIKHKEKGHISANQARAHLASVERKTKAEQVVAFENVCARFPPTFRFHFLERHRIPITLLTNRLSYTRSVATTSIVGHILGLGDRHVSNILLDDLTGEVVHIDFGVAFDQGKLLPIPEQVPFRLTRDMVDGMGLNGVEGVYRRCCQETLRVMREGASVIQTVLQVFKYDPLYDWTQNPIKVIRAQAHASQEASNSAFDSVHRRMTHQVQQRSSGGNSGGGGGGGGGETKDVAELLAERAIATVMEKLSKSLSVEYTVNDLMMQARDYGNLASIFQGWQAAL